MVKQEFTKNIFTKKIAIFQLRLSDVYKNIYNSKYHDLLIDMYDPDISDIMTCIDPASLELLFSIISSQGSTICFILFKWRHFLKEKNAKKCRCCHHKKQHKFDEETRLFECILCDCDGFFSEVVMCYSCEDTECLNLDPDALDTYCDLCTDRSINDACSECLWKVK